MTTYPIGTPVEQTRRWFAKVLMPRTAVSPCGQLIDAVNPVYVGNIESGPGDADLARNLAGRAIAALALGDGFRVVDVYHA